MRKSFFQSRSESLLLELEELLLFNYNDKVVAVSVYVCCWAAPRGGDRSQVLAGDWKKAVMADINPQKGGNPRKPPKNTTDHRLHGKQHIISMEIYRPNNQ